jgi:hypothetical protein
MSASLLTLKNRLVIIYAVFLADAISNLAVIYKYNKNPDEYINKLRDLKINIQDLKNALQFGIYYA